VPVDPVPPGRPDLDDAPRVDLWTVRRGFAIPTSTTTWCDRERWYATRPTTWRA
jgi:hypothetical protein